MSDQSGHKDPDLYQECIKSATPRFNSKSIKTCPRGYCTAKAKYEVYPSAYANGYASSVCQGHKPDFLKVKQPNQKYMERIGKLKSGDLQQSSNMGRWFKENWVNVCEPKTNGQYQPCGRKKGKLNQNDYPYCRPEFRIDNHTPMTVGEIIEKHGEAEIANLCQAKRSRPQGVEGKPTYLRTTTTQRSRSDKRSDPRSRKSKDKIRNKSSQKSKRSPRKSPKSSRGSKGSKLSSKEKVSRFGRACQGYKQSQGGLNISDFRQEILKHIPNKKRGKYQDQLPTMNQKQLISLVEQLGLKPQSGGHSHITEPNMNLVTQYNALDKCQHKDLYLVTPAHVGKKKLQVKVLNKEGQQQTVAFGHKDYQDYTRHRDEKRRKNYCSRSKGIRCSKNPGGICDQTSPNFWSRTALWDCPMDSNEICQSVTDQMCREKLDCR